MIDEHGLSGGRTGLGQSLAAGEHVDERRLAHVTAADKGILGQFGVGTLAVIAIADLIFG